MAEKLLCRKEHGHVFIVIIHSKYKTIKNKHVNYADDKNTIKFNG
jgi:hypothetical protein